MSSTLAAPISIGKCINWEVCNFEHLRICDLDFQISKWRLYSSDRDGLNYVLRMEELSDSLFKPFSVMVRVEVYCEDGGWTSLCSLSQKTHVVKLKTEGDRAPRQIVTLWKHPRRLLDWLPALRFRFLAIFEAHDFTDSATAIITMPNTCLESLLEEFSKPLEFSNLFLVLQHFNYDVEFLCADQSIKAHSVIVSAQSPVIASMLQSNTVECRTKTIKITNMEPDIFKQFLCYLYTEKLNKLTFDSAMKLYEAGHQYVVPRLTTMCSNFLMEHLSTQNVCEVFVVAERHSDVDLVDEVVDYMVGNRVPQECDRSSTFCDDHDSDSIITMPNTCLESLWEEFSKCLVLQDLNYDVEFLCADQSTKAHSVIVCSRSPVITSMLQSNMVECGTRTITIPNMEPDIFKQFLHYLYTEKLDQLTFDSAMKLYEAGNQYVVPRLTTMCSNFLMEHLSIQNACEVLVVVDRHSDVDLVDKVVDYMVWNEVPVVWDRCRWLTFCNYHPILANKVLNRYCEIFFQNL